VHTFARDLRDTGCSQIAALYDEFVRLDPSPIVALNRVIAVAEIDDQEVAQAAVDRLADPWGYHAYHDTALTLRRLGRGRESCARLRQGDRAGGQHRGRLLGPPP
jgi:RNA polymerase sigma-70 factor (ECF subfamily)